MDSGLTVNQVPYWTAGFDSQERDLCPVIQEVKIFGSQPEDIGSTPVQGIWLYSIKASASGCLSEYPGSSPGKVVHQLYERKKNL